MRFIFTYCILLISLFTEAQTRSAVAKAPVDSSLFYNDTIIKWMTIEEALAAQKKSPKKILVNVYAAWCRWCKMEDSLAFKNREIAHYINQNFYPVKFNAESKTPVIYKDVRYVFINEENTYVNEFARFLLYGKLSYPGTAFIDERGYLISAKNGYMDAYYLEAVLNYYGSGSYKKMSYSEFEDNFEGKIEE